MAPHAVSTTQKPHAVCIPCPAQGHINPMLKVAKLLHARGFHVTFVNSVYNHNRLLHTRGPNSLDGFPSFRFEAIPDGLPETNHAVRRDIVALSMSTMTNCLAPFKELLRRINSGGDVPPVSCIVSDGVMSFTLDVAEELGVPEVLLWTISACGFMAYLHFHTLVEKGLCPLKDERDVSLKEQLETVIDWIPSMNNLRLKHIPSFIRTTNPNDIMLNSVLHESERAKRASAIILNTFDDLEHDVIRSMQSMLPPVYSIGPLHLLANRESEEGNEIGRLGLNLWKEQRECLDWLDTKSQNSVVYVNFGSVAVMNGKQLVEFAWGLAATGKDFLWVTRPGLVSGKAAVVPPEFLKETEGRRMVASWCPQEKVLSHPAVGGFLTHSGWNSTLESLCDGVPMVCWPFFAEQQTNCKFCCDDWEQSRAKARPDWEVGMEIGGDGRREEVEAVVREMMDGAKGKKMREKAEEWRRLAVAATEHPFGSSVKNFETVVNKVFLGRGDLVTNPCQNGI